MPAADPREVVEPALSSVGPWDPVVVDLKILSLIASRHHTDGIANLERGPQTRRDGTSEVSHRLDVGAFGQEPFDDRVAGQRAGGGGGDTSHAGDLAALF